MEQPLGCNFNVICAYRDNRNVLFNLQYKPLIMVLNLKINWLKRFREFDRKSDPVEHFGFSSSSKINTLIKSIKLDGLSDPLELWVFGFKALLVQGSHRLIALNELNYTHIPVKIKFRLFLTGEMLKRKSRFKNIIS